MPQLGREGLYDLEALTTVVHTLEKYPQASSFYAIVRSLLQ